LEAQDEPLEEKPKHENYEILGKKEERSLLPPWPLFLAQSRGAPYPIPFKEEITNRIYIYILKTM
jgi:hypothetical protein